MTRYVALLQSGNVLFTASGRSSALVAQIESELSKVFGYTATAVLFAGSGVLYFSRLILKASQSQLSRLVSMPVYKKMTIRSWNTTRRLLEILEARGSDRRRA